MKSRKASDEALMLKLKHTGSRNVWGEIYSRYERRLFSYLVRLCGSQDVAEEIFQETFFQMYRKRELFDEKYKLAPWLYRIATNLWRDELRKRAVRRQTYSLDQEVKNTEGKTTYYIDLFAANVELPDHKLEQQELAQQLELAIRALPDGQRTVFLLRQYQDLNYQEISDVLGIPIGTVKSRMHGAIKAIYKQVMGKEKQAYKKY